MQPLRSTHGISVIEVVVALVLIGMVITAGYLIVIPRNRTTPATVTSTDSAPIASSEDLDQTSDEVDSATIDQDLDASLDQINADMLGL